MNDKKWLDIQEEEYSKIKGGIHFLNNSIAEIIGSNKDVLDIGCLNGELGNLLSSKGNRVVGIDLPKVIEAHKLKYKFKSMVADAEELNLISGSSFDIVTANEVIEHLQNPELFIKHAYRILRNGGCLLITTPYGFFEDKTHCRGYDELELIKQVRDNDFRIRILQVLTVDDNTESIYLVAKKIA